VAGRQYAVLCQVTTPQPHKSDCKVIKVVLSSHRKSWPQKVGNNLYTHTHSPGTWQKGGLRSWCALITPRTCRI